MFFLLCANFSGCLLSCYSSGVGPQLEQWWCDGEKQAGMLNLKWVEAATLRMAEAAIWVSRSVPPLCLDSITSLLWESRHPAKRLYWLVSQSSKIWARNLSRSVMWNLEEDWLKAVKFARNSPLPLPCGPFSPATLHHGHDGGALGALLSCEVTLGWMLQLYGEQNEGSWIPGSHYASIWSSDFLPLDFFNGRDKQLSYLNNYSHLFVVQVFCYRQLIVTLTDIFRGV